MDITLEAKTEFEKMILEYLKNNATEILKEKINSCGKTLKGCWNYITQEAKKKSSGGCACVPDDEVFGWAMHYFEEDSIEEQKKGANLSSATATVPKKKEPEKKPEPKPVVKEKPPVTGGQMSLFDLL